jgi:predicted AAA+ superfamily ATPase
MDMKELFIKIISSFHTTELPEIIPRDVSIPVDSGAVIAVIGARRSGKTYVILDIIKKLIKSGISKKYIIYINFEDERLEYIRSADLDNILQAYQQIYPKNKMSDTYFFLDEIQNVKGWEKFVRRIHESVSKKIFITGSNSKFLGSEIATELGGRSLPYEVYPLSFKEYLLFKNIPYNRNSIYSSSERAMINNAFEEYLLFGGFPEVVMRREIEKIATLQNYFNVMITTDLIRRYNLESDSIIRFFVKQIINSNAKEFSINKIYNSFRSVGYKIGNNTLYNYLDYVKAIYLVFVLNKYETNLRLKEQGSKKIYSIDSGLYNAVNINEFDDKSKLLENVIFLHLFVKYNKEVSFYKDEYSECDFILSKNNKVQKAIQVSYSIVKEDTRKREITGLVRACKALKLSNGTIITYGTDESSVESEGITIDIVSAPKYLLLS